MSCLEFGELKHRPVRGLMPRPARAVLWNDSQIDIAMGVVLECLLQGKALKHWHCVIPVQLAVNLYAHGFAVRSRCEH